MNISDHITFLEQEMKRRNYSQQSINNYASCLRKFFGQSTKDHPKNIGENNIRILFWGRKFDLLENVITFVPLSRYEKLKKKAHT